MTGRATPALPQRQHPGQLLPGSSGISKIRILFVFDPWRSAVLLVAGDKSEKWNRWYAEAIPHAEQLHEIYLKERAPGGEAVRPGGSHVGSQ